MELSRKSKKKSRRKRVFNISSTINVRGVPQKIGLYGMSYIYWRKLVEIVPDVKNRHFLLFSSRNKLSVQRRIKCSLKCCRKRKGKALFATTESLLYGWRRGW